MSMKIVYSMAVIICAAMWFGSCQNEELDYYPLEKKHLGETYTEYVMNNIISNDTVSRIALNFYPEEVTSLSYVDYDESTCIFTFHRGNTSRYRLSWDYETDGSYVEVQYGQNGMWYTVNEQKHSGEYLLTANDGMSVPLAGEFKNGCIENCTSKVDISFADNKGICTLCLGGLVGDLDSYGSEVEVALRGKIINEGNLTVNPCSDAYIGGVIGRATNYGKIFIKENVCVENKGDLTVQWKADAQPDHSYIGGVVGLFKTNETDIEHLHNWGNIRLDTQNTSATFNIGGVCGELTPHNYERIYPLDLYNAGNIEIKHDLLAEFSAIGGVIGSFGGSSFHQVVNEGKIIVSGKGCKYISGLLGSESSIHGNCYLHSCCVDKVGAYPVWNISYHPVTKQVPCKENHPTNQK